MDIEKEDSHASCKEQRRTHLAFVRQECDVDLFKSLYLSSGAGFAKFIEQLLLTDWQQETDRLSAIEETMKVKHLHDRN